MESKNDKQLCIRISDELMNQLKAMAKQDRRSVAQLVRLAIEKYLEPKGHSL